MPPGTPTPSDIPPAKSSAKPKGSSSWNHLRRQANSIASIIVFVLFLMTSGAIAGYFYFKSRQAPSPSQQSVSISNLSPSEISKLSEISTNLGTAGQTLNIGADALLRGKVDIGGDLSVA